MLNLIERLRTRKAFFINGSSWLMTNSLDADCAEAADEIERLRNKCNALHAVIHMAWVETNKGATLMTDDVRAAFQRALAAHEQSSTPYRDAVDDVNGIKRSS